MDVCVPHPIHPGTGPRPVQQEAESPDIAIGLFCGLRPENELRNLDWRNVIFDGDRPFIRVDAETTKTHASRDVFMPANLVEWLAPYRRSSGTIG